MAENGKGGDGVVCRGEGGETRAYHDESIGRTIVPHVQGMGREPKPQALRT